MQRTTRISNKKEHARFFRLRAVRALADLYKVRSVAMRGANTTAIAKTVDTAGLLAERNTSTRVCVEKTNKPNSFSIIDSAHLLTRAQHGSDLEQILCKHVIVMR